MLTEFHYQWSHIAKCGIQENNTTLLKACMNIWSIANPISPFDSEKISSGHKFLSAEEILIYVQNESTGT